VFQVCDVFVGLNTAPLSRESWIRYPGLAKSGSVTRCDASMRSAWFSRATRFFQFVSSLLLRSRRETGRLQ
jgi:hypothetical protein